MHHTHTITTHNSDETRACGFALGHACRGGEVLLLSGDLGAGKTCLVQGLARGLGVPDDVPVTSPSYTLHSQYAGHLELNHIDLYRLGEHTVLADLGWDDLFGDPCGVVALEWAEYMDAPPPADHLGIHLRLEDASTRSIRLTALGEQHTTLLQAVTQSQE